MRKALTAPTAPIAFAAPQGAFAVCQGENTGNVLHDPARPATAGTLATSFAGATTVNVNAGGSCVVNGAAHAADAALVTAAAEMKWLNGFSLAATFEGEFSNVTTGYAGKGMVRYAW